jgi:hypothetical protein
MSQGLKENLAFSEHTIEVHKIPWKYCTTRKKLKLASFRGI